MRVFVAGASGVVGRPLCRRLVEGGHTVVALTRTAATADKLAAPGIEPVVADIFDVAAVIAAVSAAKADAVVHQLTAIPPRTHPRHVDRDFAPTNRLRTEGTRILLTAARTAKVPRFVAQSIAFVLSPDGRAAGEGPVWLDPPDQPGFRELHAAVDELETQVTSADLHGIVLRYGSFYGPRTVYAPGGSIHEDVGRRKLPIVGNGDGVFSFIHVEDAAAAAVAALAGGERGIYNIVDDEPAAVRDWLPYYAECIGAPSPRSVPAWIARPLIGAYGIYLMTQQRAISNAKAKLELDWAPAITSWKTGFRERLDR